MGLPYEEFVKIPLNKMWPMAIISIVYTFMLACLLIVVMNSISDDANDLQCQDYIGLWYTNGSDTTGQILFYNSNIIESLSQGYLCTDAENTKELNSNISIWVKLGSIGIFICYLMYKVGELTKGRSLSGKLEKDGHQVAARIVKLITFMNIVQIFLVEACGLTSIQYSVDAITTLTNSSATIFLAEVDDIMLELYSNSIITFLELEVGLEFAGIEFEGILKLEKKKSNKEGDCYETEIPTLPVDKEPKKEQKIYPLVIENNQ